MEFKELIESRYSVRAYQPTPVEDEKLHQVLEAARLAPTAANRQPFRLIVITTQGRESELQRIYSRGWFTQAPLIICACAVPEEGWVRMDGKPYVDVDVTIAMDHLILAAAAEGLGTCWIGAFKPDKLRELLGIPPELEPVALTPLGYPDQQPEPGARKALEDMIEFR